MKWIFFTINQIDEIKFFVVLLIDSSFFDVIFNFCFH